MSERLKYSSNGVYKIENFVRCLATGQFPKQSIGSYSWIFGSYITLKIREEYNQLYPYIFANTKPKLKIRAFFNIKSKFWSLCYQTNGSIHLESDDGVSGPSYLESGVSGPSIGIQDVLNEENGYLENGALTVEYGFHIDAILGYNDIWTFNFNGNQFNSEKENNTISVKCCGMMYYSPKPLLVFHSSLFGHETKEIFLEDEVDEYYAERCLQIANGVRLQNHGYHWFKNAEVGRGMNMMNVVHYCDSMIIRTCPGVLRNEKFLKTAIKVNMRQCALHMIGLRGLKEVLKKLRDDLDEIPGEMMKVIIRKFINEKI